MAIGVKTVRRPNPSETSYLRATLRGMRLTFKHMFLPKWTMQYPDQKDSDAEWTLSKRWRGTHRMAVDENGKA